MGDTKVGSPLFKETFFDLIFLNSTFSPETLYIYILDVLLLTLSEPLMFFLYPMSNNSPLW